MLLLTGLIVLGIATIAGAVWITRVSTLDILHNDARKLAVHWANHVGELTPEAAGTPDTGAPRAGNPRRFQAGRYTGVINRYAVFDATGSIVATGEDDTRAEIRALAGTPVFAADLARTLASGEPVLRHGDAISAATPAHVARVLVPVASGDGDGRVVLVETDQSAAFAVIDRATDAVVILVATLVALGTGIPLFFVWRRLGDHWRLQEHVQFLASNDALTGLPNRAGFLHSVGEALELSERGREKAAILCLDIDRFRQTNDALGHTAGDHVLRHVSRTIRDTIARHDAVAARLGGDEFAILVRGPAAHEQALQLARALRDRLRVSRRAGQDEFTATVSMGMAVGPCDGADAASLVKHADIALNQARAHGPDASRFYTPSMERAVRRRDSLERALRKAMEQDELHLLYQPQFDLVTGRVTGYEALLRWNHPEEGIVSPADFIASAEETGLILEMGEWALRTGCRYAASWPGTTNIAINLSAMQLMHGDIYETVAAVLAETGLAPERLELEITESLLLHDVERVQTTLRKFAELGVSLAVDDFGTGYSSLSYLASFRFTRIKVDRCFVSAIGAGEEASAVIRAIVGLGKALAVEIIAEGVETPEQLAFLRQAGCRSIQGFLCGRPEPRILGDWDATVAAARLARPERLREAEQAAAAQPLPVTQRSA